MIYDNLEQLPNLWLGLVKFEMRVKPPIVMQKKCSAVTSAYLCISIYLVSGPIILDLVTYLLILQMYVQIVHIVLSENVKTTCAFPFILMPLTGARWRQRHIFHC